MCTEKGLIYLAILFFFLRKGSRFLSQHALLVILSLIYFVLGVFGMVMIFFLFLIM